MVRGICLWVVFLLSLFDIVCLAKLIACHVNAFSDLQRQVEFNERLERRKDYALRYNIRLYEENIDVTNENFKNIDEAFKKLRDYFIRVQ